MLKNTFCHIPGVGERIERRLWDEGILTWEGYLQDAKADCGRGPFVRERLNESFIRLGESDAAYFADRLDARQAWRLFPEFRGSAAYIDIETNGYVGPGGYITAISLYDGSTVRHYVKGINLNDFKRDIRDFKLIVTFNGRCFDVPFLESHFRMKMPHAHIDLRFILKDLGFSGGLKACEKTLGIDRGALDGVDGYFAVLLWHDFKRNRNSKALETLIAYNMKDAVNLEPLMVAAYNMKLKGTPFSRSHAIEAPAMPELPFMPDSNTIARILSANERRYPNGFAGRFSA